MNWTRAENIVCEELSGGALLVNPANGGRWSLNESAAALWRICDGRKGAAELARAIKCSQTQVAAFCAQFSELGLLKPALSGATGTDSMIVMTYHHAAPEFKLLGLGNGPRRRPTPRGVSGPG